MLLFSTRLDIVDSMTIDGKRQMLRVFPKDTGTTPAKIYESESKK